MCADGVAQSSHAIILLELSILRFCPRCLKRYSPRSLLVSGRRSSLPQSHLLSHLPYQWTPLSTLLPHLCNVGTKLQEFVNLCFSLFAFDAGSHAALHQCQRPQYHRIIQLGVVASGRTADAIGNSTVERDGKVTNDQLKSTANDRSLPPDFGQPFLIFDSSSQIQYSNRD